MSVDRDSVRARLVGMRELLDHLESMGAVTSGRLRDDLAVRLQVERVLSQVITLATEVNTHVVARECGRAPEDLRDGFGRMVDAGWLPAGLAARLRDSTGLRNVLVHEYVRVDLGIVSRAVPECLEGYSAYIREVAARL